MSISAYFEKQIELERLREQQTQQGGSGRGHGPPLHGRRASAEGRPRGLDECDLPPQPAPAPQPDEWERPDEEDEQILLRFYTDVEPEFANPLRVQKIIKSFQRKAARTGADWREWMYSDMLSKRGIDPREHVAGSVGTAQPDAELDRAPPAVVARPDPRALLRSRDRRPDRRRTPGSGGRAAQHPQDLALEATAAVRALFCLYM